MPILRAWCPKDQLVGNSVDKALSGKFNILHFKNGSSIQFMTQGMDVDAFQGSALSRVHFDEEPLWDHGRDIYGECAQRLVDYDGDVLLTFTPLNGMCVDDETECLTKRGWKRHDQLEDGDILLTWNGEERATEW